MNLRRLNPAGLQQFADYLGRVRENPSAPPPFELLTDGRFVELPEFSAVVEPREFATKFAAGVYLRDLLAHVPASQLRVDAGVWSWLALRFFNQLCPANAHGRRTEIRENAKYIPRPGDHRYGPDKHLLFFPWKMVSLHGDHARCFLGGAVGIDTRAQRAWTAYHFNVSTELVALGARLFGDPRTGLLKPGAVSSSRRGNLNRFVQVLKQIEVTYDVRGLSAEDLLTLLPVRDFEGWVGRP